MAVRTTDWQRRGQERNILTSKDVHGSVCGLRDAGSVDEERYMEANLLRDVAVPQRRKLESARQVATLKGQDAISHNALNEVA